jgi:hypothetical protein
MGPHLGASPPKRMAASWSGPSRRANRIQGRGARDRTLKAGSPRFVCGCKHAHAPDGVAASHTTNLILNANEDVTDEMVLPRRPGSRVAVVPPLPLPRRRLRPSVCTIRLMFPLPTSRNRSNSLDSRRPHTSNYDQCGDDSLPPYCEPARLRRKAGRVRASRYPLNCHQRL